MKKNTGKYTRKHQNYVTILGINVLSTDLASLLTNVEERISDSSKFYITTPNPELILASTSNQKLKVALNSSDFAVPDGIGLNYACKLLYNRTLNIIHGRILFDKLIELADRKGWKVFLLGGLGDEAELAAQKLQITNPKLQIQSFRGPRLNVFGTPITMSDKKLEQEAVAKINNFAPQLLFVAFGNPKQEIWILKNLSNLKIGGAMAVGGTFRYIAGLSPLPPKWVSNLGLEWLWRLVTEPKRIVRIFRAVIVFPLKVFIYKITQ